MAPVEPPERVGNTRAVRRPGRLPEVVSGPLDVVGLAPKHPLAAAVDIGDHDAALGVGVADEGDPPSVGGPSRAGNRYSVDPRRDRARTPAVGAQQVDLRAIVLERDPNRPRERECRAVGRPRRLRITRPRKRVGAPARKSHPSRSVRPHRMDAPQAEGEGDVGRPGRGRFVQEGSVVAAPRHRSSRRHQRGGHDDASPRKPLTHDLSVDPRIGRRTRAPSGRPDPPV